MPFFAHANVLDNGLAYIKANCDKVALLSTYTAGQNHATVTSNILAQATVDADDFTLANGADGARKLVFAAGITAEAASATAAASGTKHIAFLDTTNERVLWVTPETTGQAITTGNPVTFPSLEYHAYQPELLED